MDAHSARRPEYGVGGLRVGTCREESYLKPIRDLKRSPVKPERVATFCRARVEKQVDRSILTRSVVFGRGNQKAFMAQISTLVLLYVRYAEVKKSTSRWKRPLHK